MNRGNITHFVLISDETNNGYHYAALKLAESALSSESCFLPRVSEAALDPKRSPTPSLSGVNRVTTNMPERSLNNMKLGCNIANSHRGRSLISRLQQKNLQKLTEASDNPRRFWETYRELAGRQLISSHISVDALASTFMERMNPLCPLPASFDEVLYTLNEDLATWIPKADQELSDPLLHALFSVNEIKEAKTEIHKHSPRSSKGLDDVGYRDIEKMDDELLTSLINDSIAAGECPDMWTHTILIAISKRGNLDPLDPKSYRAIGLECCLVKFVTLLIRRCLVAWAEQSSIIPPSQNEFRKNYRTNNNAFILRTAIEKTRAMGKSLYVASVDISNTFPHIVLPYG